MSYPTTNNIELEYWKSFKHKLNNFIKGHGLYLMSKSQQCLPDKVSTICKYSFLNNDNRLNLSVPDEGHSRDALCVLN